MTLTSAYKPFTLAILLATLIGISGNGPNAEAATGQLTVVDLPVLSIDPSANSASALLRIRNDSAQSLTISLSAGPFISKTTRQDVGAKITFTGPTDTAGKPTYELAALAPQTTQSIKVEVTNLWEAGESAAELFNNGQKVAELKALKYRPTFSVKLGTASANPLVTEDPEIVFEKGRPGLIVLKNDDAMTYPVRWEILLPEKTVSGADVVLPPSSAKTVEFNVPQEWFTAGFSGLFKDEVRNATLVLAFDPPLSQEYPLLPQKTVPVKLRLRNWSSSGQYLIGIPIILGVLFIGALCSLMLRDWGPNRLRRIEIEERLDNIESDLQKLSGLGSSVKAPVRVGRAQLQARLRMPVFFSPELPAVFKQCEDGVTILEGRREVLKALSDAFGRRDDKRKLKVSPFLLMKASEQLEHAASMLRRADPKENNFEAALSLINAANTILDKITDQNEDLVAELVRRVKALRPKFDLTQPNPFIATATFGRIRAKLPNLFESIQTAYEDAANIKPELYFSIDVGTAILTLCLDYVPFFEEAMNNGNAEPEQTQKLNKCDAEFLKQLSEQSLTGLEKATLILMEMKQNVFVESIKDAIRNGEISISREAVMVVANQPIQFRVDFKNGNLNNAAALNEVHCLWEFTQEGRFGSNLRERGWVMWHYFPKARRSTVTVKFKDRQTNELIKDGAGNEVTLSDTFNVVRENSRLVSERAWIEITWFCIALFAALIALVAGAREQLLKLDVAAGLIAVFMIGFSTDTLKNLLTQPNRT